MGEGLRLAAREREELEGRLRKRSSRAEEARIARVLLLLDEGASYVEIQEKVGCTAPFISKWKRRFLADGLAGLYSRHLGRVVRVLTPKMEARILAKIQKPPTDGSTHWSTRRLASELGVHHMMVARTWRKHGLQPHRLRRYCASTDPDFEQKAADVIGLYLHPPQHAAIFCVDEKTAIQALDRRDRVLPLSPGRVERHGFEYVRHGTLSLYAAFNTKSGEVFGKTARRHTPARGSSPSWRTSSLASQRTARFTSSSTTSALTKRPGFRSSSLHTPMSASTSLLLTALGSTKWSGGSPRSNAT